MKLQLLIQLTLITLNVNCASTAAGGQQQQEAKSRFFAPFAPFPWDIFFDPEDVPFAVPYRPETSWTNVAYEKPGVYGGGWGTQMMTPVVLYVRGKPTKPYYGTRHQLVYPINPPGPNGYSSPVP